MISFDGKIGGTVQLGLGSHSQGGDRDESAVLWTLACDLRRGGRLSVDGELIQVDGRFVGI
jgi:aminopeptidase